MAINLTERFLSELKKGSNTPNVVIEIELDGGTRRFGYHGQNVLPITRFTAAGDYTADGKLHAVGATDLPGVVPALESVSSLQNKLDPKSGFSTRGRLTVVIKGRDVFKTVIRDEYLKNRRVTRRDGFLAPGFTYADYAPTFTGRVLDWSRRGDTLTLTVADDLKDASQKIPSIPEGKDPPPQYIDYRNMNPVDIMKDILLSRLGIDAAYVDTGKFDSERDTWLNGWVFDRVITTQKKADEYLNELQIETNSFIVHDGEKVSFKVFAPPLPKEVTERWNDRFHILDGTFSQKSGYTDNFYNKVALYYDYDESGQDKDENYEALYIAVDASSQDVSQWNDVETKVIKSKWIRTRTYTQPVNITGVTVYHCSRNNGFGTGQLTFTYDPAGGGTLQWTAPGGTMGEAVKLSKNGKFQIFDLDRTKWLRVLVDTSKLPTADATDQITISRLSGDNFAAALANKVLARYRNPASTVSFKLDINNVAYNGFFIKPTDLKDITTDEACEKGADTWTDEKVMLTSVRPDFSGLKVDVEAIQTRMYRRYGFIAPAGLPDYQQATSEDRNYAFIGSPAGNKVNGGTEEGYVMW